ncbi:MAG: hypothetical protein O3A00_20665 [Planctomycetota bacterium]|nr:hypothetical protein [Planctomycetota bacterium]
MRLGVRKFGSVSGGFFVLALIFAVSPTGCAHRGNNELLESRLRAQEERIAAVTRQKEDLGHQLAAARRERELLRRQTADSPHLFPEQIQAASAVESIQIHRLLSGYIDRESPAMKLVVQPIDGSGEVRRGPGQFRIIAKPAPPEGEPNDLIQVGSTSEEPPVEWTFSTIETEDAWHSGFGRGYHFSLPIQPAAQQVAMEFRVIFSAVDGRRFETSEVISPAANE